MIGTSFLGNMQATLKRNREILRAVLRKKRRKPFDDFAREKRGVTPEDPKQLSPTEKSALILKVKHDNQIELLKKVINLIIILTILILSLWLLPIVFDFLIHYR